MIELENMTVSYKSDNAPIVAVRDVQLKVKEGALLAVRQNILAPTLAITVPDAEARADELIAQFGLEDRVTHEPSKLSAGERQRVATARALLTRR